MSKELFNRYMHWSWPIVKHALTAKHRYLSDKTELGPRDSKTRAIGYFMERLFILWSQIERLRLVAVGPFYDYKGHPIERQRMSELLQAAQVT